MNRVWTIATLLACGLLTACGSDDESTPSGNAGSSAGGSAGSSAGGSAGSSVAGSAGEDPGESLYINAAVGLSTIDKPFANEGKGATGLIAMEYSEDDLSSAVVKVNGTQLKLLPGGLGESIPGVFDLATSEVPGPGASGVFKVDASYNGMTATGSLPCPAGVTITSPAEGDSFAMGDTISVTWTGSVATGHPVSKSSLSLLGYDSVANKEVGSVMFQDSKDGVTVSLEDTATGGELKAYEPAGGDTAGFDGWVVQVNVLGSYIDVNDAVGYCSTISRVHLKKK